MPQPPSLEDRIKAPFTDHPLKPDDYPKAIEALASYITEHFIEKYEPPEDYVYNILARIQTPDKSQQTALVEYAKAYSLFFSEMDNNCTKAARITLRNFLTKGLLLAAPYGALAGAVLGSTNDDTLRGALFGMAASLIYTAFVYRGLYKKIEKAIKTKFYIAAIVIRQNVLRALYLANE